MRYPVPQETGHDSAQRWITSDYKPIDLAACYDFPIDSPLPSWEDWQAMRSEANPFHSIIERKIGNTQYTILTDCAGGETLIDKVKQDHYVCSNYKSGRGECSCHYIREDVLRNIVLERIRAVTAYVRENAEGFQLEWMQSTCKAQNNSIRQNQKQLAQAKKRLEDTDTLITRLYEDHVLGSLSDDRYQKMTTDYEAEQERLKTEIAVMEEWIDQQQEDNDNYDRFAGLVESMWTFLH